MTVRLPRRSTAWRFSHEKVDYSKTCLYAWTDLLVKTISAIALAALGIAGWQLQSRSENARRVLDARDRLERKYLPMLRTLSELEIVLAELSIALPRVQAESQPSRNYRMSVIGQQLSYLGYSLLMPDGDQPVPVRPPRFDPAENPWRHIPLRSGAVMFGELTRAHEFFANFPTDARVRIERGSRELRVKDSKGYLGGYFVSPEAAPAWEAWLENDAIPISDLFSPNVVILAEHLRRGTASYIHRVVTQRPDLGDRYVTIRSEVFQQQAQLVQPFRTTLPPTR